MKAKAIKKHYVTRKKKRIEVGDILPVIDGTIQFEGEWICDVDSKYARIAFVLIEDDLT